MKDTEKFLRAATRGLWGRAKRDAALELRGAVEDKIYRYTLLGMTEADAERTALRDLGSPAAIARELGVVHSVPQGAKVALFIALAGALGLQAAAQIPAVRAMPTPRTELEYRQGACDFSPDAIAQAPQASADYMRKVVQHFGSAEKARANCLDTQPNPNLYLRLSDVVAALEVGGIRVQSADNGLVTVKLPDRELRSADFSQDSRTIDGEFYALKYIALEKLLILVDGSARLSGVVNPVLSIGPVKMQLGTPKTPLSTGDLLAPIVERHFRPQLERSLPAQTTDTFRPVMFSIFEDYSGGGGPEMAVSAPEGTWYVTLSTQNFAPQQGQPRTPDYLLSVNPVQGGKLPQPSAVSRNGQLVPPRLVRTMPELVQAGSKTQHAALLYRLDTSDLRNIKYLPVSPSEVKLLKASWQK